MKILLFRSIDAEPDAALVDLPDAFRGHAERFRKLHDQAVAVISGSLGLLLDAVVGKAIDDELGLLSRQYLFFWKATQSFPWPR
jgi:hypothetical protein